MSEQKKTFEAPVLTSLQIEPVDNVGTSAKTWNTNRYGSPALNDRSDQ